MIAMAGEHRDAVVDEGGPHSRTFTLKELVRLLEALPPAPAGTSPDALTARVEQADEARREGSIGNPLDEDVADPLGLPVQSYRAIAWELDEWISRLVEGLFGSVPVSAVNEG